MILGERIKQTRLQLGLSQRQLCGDEITRNMLSQIENGSARPSMTTLAYLAKRLGKPISYFLEEQATLSPNQQVMIRARQAFVAGEYADVLQELENYGQPDTIFDSERWLLETLALMKLANQAADEGKSVYAKTLLERAEDAGACTPYFTGALERERILLLYAARPEEALKLVSRLPEDDRELLLRAQALLAAGEYAEVSGVLEAARKKSPRWYYLRGQAAMAQKDYAGAVEFFSHAQTAYPAKCAQALEQCYRELEDYKMAYYYACKQREGNY